MSTKNSNYIFSWVFNVCKDSSKLIAQNEWYWINHAALPTEIPEGYLCICMLFWPKKRSKGKGRWYSPVGILVWKADGIKILLKFRSEKQLTTPFGVMLVYVISIISKQSERAKIHCLLCNNGKTVINHNHNILLRK